MVAISETIQGVHADRPLVASRRIRVLLVITGLATGGATNVILDLADHFNSHHEFDVQLLTGPIPPGRNDATNLAYDLGIPTRVIPSLVNHINPIKNMKAVVDIGRIMVQGNYDIVHTHSSVAGVVGRLAAFSAGIPVIIHHVHGWGLRVDMSRWSRLLYLTLERFCAKFSDTIIAVSKPNIQKGLSQGIGTKDQFNLIYNGIDLKKFRQSVEEQQVRSELGLDPDCKLVGMIGRLDEQKNPLDFIRAAAIASRSYPNAQFLIVGGGSLRDDCERLINELGLKEKVFLLGFRDDVARILPILTITVMSSLWEGLPLAFLESMSAGKPIVANNIDGARDVVVDGETGFLVNPRQPQEMAERILTLLNDETLCNKMGGVAQQRSEYFSLERMLGQVESLYKEQLSKAHPNADPLRRLLGWMAGRGLEITPDGFVKPRQNFLSRITEKYSRFSAPFSERRLLLGMGDIMSFLMAQVLTILLWSKSNFWGLDAVLDQQATWYLFTPILAIWFSLAWLNDLYHIPSSYNKFLSLRRIVQTTVLTITICAGVFYFFPDVLPLDYYFRLAFLLIPLAAFWRFFYAVVFKRTLSRQRILLLSDGSQAGATMREIQKCTWVNFDVVGYMHEAESKTKTNELHDLGQIRQLLSAVDNYKINEIVVAINGSLDNKLFEGLVACQAKGIRVNWIADFYERLYQWVPVEHIDPSWALYMMQSRPIFSRLELALKRFLDLVLVLFTLPVLPFIFIPVALAIKLESPGPVLYRQMRCGRAGELFSIFKFRTMVKDAENDGKARWAYEGDPRITRVGRFLRKTRLDELPQLLNVLRGEMSLVGPRPERPEFVEELEKEIPFYSMRLLVKPGITGWAQINYDYGNSVEHARVKLQYDFYYVRYWSIWLDLYVLYQTVGVVLKLKGT